MTRAIDPFNKYMVGAMGERIVIAKHPGSMSHEEALLLAAWLVALADPGGDKFMDYLNAVRGAE